MFTYLHFIWMALCVGFITMMLIFSLKKHFSLILAGRIMTVICILSETSKIMSNMIENASGGMVLSPRALPFHLCSLMLFGVFYITFSKGGVIRKYLINFIAVMGTLGSICAMLIPTNGVSFASIGAYQCFVYHAGLLWFSLYLICGGHAKINIKTYGQNLVFLLILTITMLYINSFLSAYGTNFMYLVRPPMENLPILNLNNGWYVYFISLLSCVFLIVTLFYLPFIIVNQRNKNVNR